MMTSAILMLLLNIIGEEEEKFALVRVARSSHDVGLAWNTQLVDLEITSCLEPLQSGPVRRVVFFQREEEAGQKKRKRS